MNTGNQPFRQQTNHREVNSADKRKALQNLADMLAGRASRPDARNEAAILAHIVRELGRIEDNANVEEREQNDQNDVDQVVQRLAESDHLAEIFKKHVSRAKNQSRRGRKGQQRTGENRRNDTARIDAQRQVRGLPAHDFAPNHSLGVLHRDAPLAAFDENDEGDDGYHQCNQEDKCNRRERPPRLSLGQLVQIQDGARQTDHNAYEYDERHAISDSALADLLAKPHDEGRAGGQGQDRHEHETGSSVVDQRARVLQRGGDGGGLDNAQHNRQIARVLRNLPPAQLTLFLQLFEVWEHHGHQLQDDRRGDVRHDAQRENRQLAQVAAAE